MTIQVAADERLEAIDALAAATADDEPRVRLAALQALAVIQAEDAHLDRVAEAIAGLLVDENPEMREIANHAFLALPIDNADKVEQYLQLLQHGDAEAVGVAQQALLIFPAEALEPIIEIMKSNMSSDLARQSAFGLLQNWGDDAADAVPALIQLYESRVEDRSHVLLILAAIGPSAEAAVPLMTAALADEDAAIREIAANAIAAVMVDPNRVLLNAGDTRQMLRRIESYFTRADGNRDGVIEGDELSLIEGLLQFDRNGDGRVTREELVAIFRRSTQSPNRGQFELRRQYPQ